MLKLDIEVEIKKFEPNYAKELIGIWKGASAVGHPFLSESFIEQEAKVIAGLLQEDSINVHMAIGKGEVLGYIALIDNEIGGLFVKPNYHRKGVGKTLVDFAKLRYSTLEVEVFKQNKIGIAFYLKYGFKQTEEKKHEPTGELLLRLKI